MIKILSLLFILIYIIIVSIFLICLKWNEKKTLFFSKNIQNTNYILCLLCIFGLFVLIFSNSWLGWDFDFHLSRLIAISDEIKKGGIAVFPLRMYNTHLGGYGYASPLFYGDIFLIPFALLEYCGVSAFLCFDLMQSIILILAFCSLYYSVLSVFKNRDMAIMASFCYVLSPYFLTDLIIRAAIGESIAFIFIPIVLLGYYYILYSNKSLRGCLLLAIGMSCVLLSHLISTIIILIFLCLHFILNYKLWMNKYLIFKYLFGAVMLSFLLTCFFTIPMLEQMNSLTFGINIVQDDLRWTRINIYSTLLPKYLFVPILDFFTGKGHINLCWKIFQVSGWGFFVLLLISVIIYYYKKITLDEKKVLLIMFVIVILCTTNLCKILNPFFSHIQYIYRILLIFTLLYSVALSYYVVKFKSRFLQIMVFAAIYLCLPFVFLYQGSSFEISKELYKHSLNCKKISERKISDIGCAEYLPHSNESKIKKDDLFKKNAKIEHSKEVYITGIDNCTFNYIFKVANKSFNYEEIIIPKLYYKGYEAKGKTISYVLKDCDISGTKLIKIIIPPRTNDIISIKYVGTITQHICTMISFLTILLLTTYIIKRKFCIIQCYFRNVFNLLRFF